MIKVQHYRGLNTDLDNLYKSIKQLLEGQKDLQIVSEYKGLINNRFLLNICPSAYDNVDNGHLKI